MGFLESVKRTFNVAGVEISVETHDDVFSQFDRVSGVVTIHGGEYERSGASITLTLKEFWTETRSSGNNTTTTVTVYADHDVVTLADAFSIEPESVHQYPFEVQLPMNCRISKKGEGWCLMVAMDIPKAVDPKEEVILNVEPAEEFLAIVDVFESSLRFEENERKRRWHEKTGTTRFRLLPPKILKEEIDYARLELQQTEDGSVVGQMVVDLQEKSLTDYFKALVNRDKVKKPIRLTNEELFLPDGEINRDALTLSIGQTLEEVIRERRSKKYG